MTAYRLTELRIYCQLTILKAYATEKIVSKYIYLLIIDNMFTQPITDFKTILHYFQGMGSLKNVFLKQSVFYFLALKRHYV